MQRYLIIYASKYGQTEKIAQFIGQHLSSTGFNFDLYSVNHIPKDVTPLSYQGVIIGAPVYRGGHSNRLLRWCKLNRNSLSQVPIAFFSVCLGILQNENTVQKQEIQIMENFLSKTNLSPLEKEIFAGALPYTKYNWIIKVIMKMIAKKAGVKTELSKDYEYTNWKQVKDFTERFIQKTLIKI